MPHDHFVGGDEQLGGDNTVATEASPDLEHPREWSGSSVARERKKPVSTKITCKGACRAPRRWARPRARP